MSTIKYKIEFFSYWHCGSGQAAGADVDALTIKDSNNLPFVPGRTVKGLLREAVETLAESLSISKEGIDLCFGRTGAGKDPQKAISFFANATLDANEAEEITSNENLWRHLYRKVSQTAIDDNGVAIDHSLRKTEVAVPCTLCGQITNVPENMVEPLKLAMGYVKHMGLGRNRGLGRCKFSVTEVENDATSTTSSKTGNVLKFKCHLESDIILNQKSASEGENKTLDFIPGSCFLGIAAAELYDTSSPEAAKNSFYIFHSGSVRFGDAHPLKDGIRSLRTPASLFYKKGTRVEDGAYVHHFYDRKKDTSGDNGQPMQLKQCRGGFYAFSNGKAIKAGTQTTFSIKSAFDRNERRAQDEQMFGYEALSAGIDMAFTVEVDDDRFSEAISKALTGLKRVGRSRSAQYGLVKIELAEDFSQAESHEAKEGDLQSVYADSRLIFIDPEGMPTTRPSVADLGFASGEIVWEKSQVRTFQYSPWNYKRQCYDADRYGIEKGSVLIVRTSAPTPKSDSDTVGSFTVGSFRNEGFGKVIFNPDFLAKSDNATNGEAKYTFPTKDKPNGNKTAKPLTTKLTKFLKKEADQEKADSDIYKKVNEFVGKNEGAFRDKEFASQWGEIRSIASGCKTKSELARRLYETADAYLTHGVASQKWGERGRLGQLQKFVDGCAEEAAPRAVIQLAAEMAKKCKR